MNIKIIIKEEIKNKNIRNKQIDECVKILRNLPNRISFINESTDEWIKDEPSPTYHWEITPEIEKDLDKSTKWVKTKEDVLEYIKIFIEEIKLLPKSFKRRVLKYILASFLGILTLNQVDSLFSNLEKNDYKSLNIEKINDKKTPVVKKEIRKPSENLYEHLKKEEGIKGKPVLYFYDLGDGAYTTGYGHAVFFNPSRGSTGGDYNFIQNYEDIIPYDPNDPDKEITRITKEQAEQLLQDDMLKASKGVNSILDKWLRKGIEPEITQGMYDAMVSIAYNYGVGNLKMSDFIQYLKRGEFKRAQEEIKNISSNMFDEYPGLKKRREKEAILFMS